MNLVEQLKKEKEILLKRLDAINVLLDTYSENVSEVVKQQVHEIKDKFPINGTQLEQIIYVIKTQNRFIHVSEITEIMAPYHIDKGKDWLRRRISAVLSHANSKGEIPNLLNIKYSPSKKDTVWGSKDWLDASGKIKHEYLYKSLSNTEYQKPDL